MVNWQAYPRLKLALQHFDMSPWELNIQQLETLEKMVAHQLDMEEKVLAYAEQSGMRIGAEALNQAIEEVRLGYQSNEQYLASMAQAGLDLPSLSEALRRELLVSQVLDKVVEGIKPLSEAAARAYYVDHLRKFLLPERREVRHILITINDEHPDNVEAVALRRIQALRSKLVSSPRQFGKLALRNSECPTALHEGKIGLVQQGQLYPELDSALFGMQAGQVSEVLRSPMGFHLLWCEAIQDAGPMPPEQAIPKIIEAQLAQARKKLQRQWLTWLMQPTE